MRTVCATNFPSTKLWNGSFFFFSFQKILFHSSNEIEYRIKYVVSMKHNNSFAALLRNLRTRNETKKIEHVYHHFHDMEHSRHHWTWEKHNALKTNWRQQRGEKQNEKWNEWTNEHQISTINKLHIGPIYTYDVWQLEAWKEFLVFHLLLVWHLAPFFLRIFLLIRNP